VKRAIRRRVVQGLEAGGILPALRRGGDRERAVILRYHSVSEPGATTFRYRCPSIAVSPDTFARQMRVLADAYDVVSLDVLAEALAGGRELPRGAVAITFDDGYLDNHRHAMPILRSFSFPATVYVATAGIGDGWRFWPSRVRYVIATTEASRIRLPHLGPIALGPPDGRRRAIDEVTSGLKRLPVDERDEALAALPDAAGVTGPPAEAREWFANWEQLREMTLCGISIGAHTCTHPILTRQDTEVAATEIRESRRLLEEGLGRPVRHFAYPNGGGVLNHDERVISLVRDAGFATATTSVNGPIRLGDDPYRLRRVGVAERHGTDGFRLNLERDRLFFLPGWKRPIRPRLIVVGPSAGAAGGVSTCVASVLRSEVADRFDITHVSPTGRGGFYELSRRGKLLQLARSLGAFLREAVLRRPAAVQVHTAQYGDFWRNAPFVVAAACLRLPTVLFIHGSRFDEFHDRSGAARRGVIRFLLRRPAALLVRGRHWQEVIRRIVPGQRVFVVPTTTEPVPERSGGPTGDGGAAPVVLFVGGSPTVADNERKGLPDLLAAVGPVRERVPGVRFRLVGPRRDALWTEQLRRVGHADAVELCGSLSRREVAEHYEAATVYVLPSLAEGMPNALLEAMAHGLPVVASDAGSIPEVLEDGKGGFLVPRGDRTALADALVRLLEDAKGAREMGRHNRERVRREFSDRRTAERLLAVYDGILG